MVNDMVGAHLTVAELKQALEGVADHAVVGIWMPPGLPPSPLWTVHPVLLGGSPADAPVFRLRLRGDAPAADAEAEA